MNLDFADNIKKLRKEKNVTQEKMAEVLGVSSQSVSRWELGICYPDLELLPAIANYFGVTIDTLLLNDSISKAKDLEEFEEKYYTLSWKTPEQIEFARDYCRKHPENNHCSYLLILAIRNHLLENRKNTEKYMPLMQKYAEKLLDTHYRMATIQLMATICPESELNIWLDMSPYTNFNRRYCLLARAEAQNKTDDEYVQMGLEKFESLSCILDSRFPDKLGAKCKEEYQLSVMRTIESFGNGKDIPDGWKTFYAYKQLVLSACQFGLKKMDEAWNNFDSAVQKLKYIYSLDTEWLDVGGEFFSNIKTNKNRSTAIDTFGNTHELFGLEDTSFNPFDIYILLTNPRWAWFNSVRETERFKEAVEWFKDAAKKLNPYNT